MSNEENTKRSGSRVLHFIASSALIVAPITGAAACGGGSKGGPATNVAPEPEPGGNVDHTEEEHTNVAPEEEGGEAGEAGEGEEGGEASEEGGEAGEEAGEDG